MNRVRLPRIARPPAADLPPHLRWDAPPASLASLALHLSRREFLKAAGVLLALVATPLTRVERAFARARGGFLTGAERKTLGALVDRIIPPEPGIPGASELGAVDYIEGLLTALDGKKTRLFAGGPFSNRNPFPDNKHGKPSHKRPRDAFKKFVAPTRVQELYWRGELFGTASVSELAALDAQYGGPKTGLRDLYRASIAKVDQVAEATKMSPFAKLSTSDQDTVLKMLDGGAFKPDPRRDGDTFIDTLIRQTLEGCFSAPEYGGNKRLMGWRLIGLEGDSQPLGYSIFDQATNAYVERSDHPMTTVNPDELAGPKPLSADGTKVQTTIASFSNSVSNL
jgi:hypothetical protein